MLDISWRRGPSMTALIKRRILRIDTNCSFNHIRRLIRDSCRSGWLVIGLGPCHLCNARQQKSITQHIRAFLLCCWRRLVCPRHTLLALRRRLETHRVGTRCHGRCRIGGLRQFNSSVEVWVGTEASTSVGGLRTDNLALRVPPLRWRGVPSADMRRNRHLSAVLAVRHRSRRLQTSMALKSVFRIIMPWREVRRLACTRMGLIVRMHLFWRTRKTAVAVAWKGRRIPVAFVAVPSVLIGTFLCFVMIRCFWLSVTVVIPISLMMIIRIRRGYEVRFLSIGASAPWSIRLIRVHH